MAKHRKISNQRRRARRLSTVGLCVSGFALAQSVVLATATADPTVVFIDGHNYPPGSERMADQLMGGYSQTPTKYFVQYPADLGLLDGFGAPTGDQSIAIAQQKLADYLADNPPSATNPTTVVGYSEGAVAASHEVSQWGPDDDIAFVLIADPERPNGGILSRFPDGTYIPLLGITAGNATSSTGAPVVMVTRQYDGVADAPAYPANALADANAFLGFYYLHSTYDTVDPNDPDNVVTTSPDGNMTDILVPAPEGELPILMPFADAGVPQPILVALDPATRALIETGYNRTDDPAQQVRFGVLPPPTAWPGDARMVVVGFVRTGERLPGAVVASVPAAPTSVPAAPTTRLVSNVQPATPAPTPAARTAASTSVQEPNRVRTTATTPTTRNPFRLQPRSGNDTAGDTPSTSTNSPSNANRPVHSAVSNVSNAIGSVARDVTRNLSRSSSTQSDSAPTG